MSQIYLCSIENNDCTKKDTCYRYKQLLKNSNNSNATLFKTACTESNNYILYIEEKEEIVNKETEENKKG